MKKTRLSGVVLGAGFTLSATLIIITALPFGGRAQAPGDRSGAALVGAWTLNHDLSDRPRDGDRSAEGRNGRGSGGHGRGGGLRRGGGFGGGGFGRDGGQGRGSEDMARMREAMRDLMTPAEHLTIVQTETMVVLAAQDGRTTRLAPGGKKIKDENTGMERETKWDQGKLVSYITGAGRGKITETYTVDPETHRLTIALTMENGREDARTYKRVYDSDSVTR